MHKGALRKWALALTFWLALHASSLRAQIFTAPLQASTTGANPVDFEFRADGTLIAKGNNGVGSLLTADQGVGTRMLWFPAKAAFRAGMIDSFITNAWDSANIGPCSVAFGRNTTASGYGSMVSGENSSASGYDSTALGISVLASGPGSTALGQTTTASGRQAMASGMLSTASGNESTAFGSGTTASGYASAAFGSSATASAQLSFVIGTYNVGGGSPTTWVATDPLFEIGNGTSSSATADALVVYKDGSATIKGPLTVTQPGGDIPMYTGN
jgi:hypothetical protein